jgi:hypothetical protein
MAPAPELLLAEEQDQMKKYRAILKAKDGSVQRVTLRAENREAAETAVLFQQFRREERFNLTFDRLQQAHDAGTLTPEQFKAEMEKRKQDQARYEGSGFKLEKIEEVKT